MITLISGTNRPNSLTLNITKYYQSLLTIREIPTQIMDLSTLPEDFVFSALYQNAGKNQKFNTFQKIIDENDKFVFIIPEYNGSFPGVVKAFIDGLRYPDSWEDKKIALVGLSAGMQGATLGLSHLQDVLVYCGANVLGMRVKMPYIHQYFKENLITYEPYNQYLDKQIEKFLVF
ncbi:MAG: NADPH-dependent oxidoreductase [Bacteroidetes bacterium]|nr:MAG: NADPH-dependent oxidoreductase [Bacteroidota bacterium]TAG87386.1 MAG: NADPH-dependent oxidoreductase [Bacteroidota bacterium]